MSPTNPSDRVGLFALETEVGVGPFIMQTKPRQLPPCVLVRAEPDRQQHKLGRAAHTWDTPWRAVVLFLFFFPLKSCIPALYSKQEARVPGSIPGSPLSECGTFSLRCSFAERQPQIMTAHVQRVPSGTSYKISTNFSATCGYLGLGSDSSSDSHFESHPPGLILSSPPFLYPTRFLPASRSKSMPSSSSLPAPRSPV